MNEHQHEEWETDRIADEQRSGCRMTTTTLSWLTLLALVAFVAFLVLTEH